MTLLRQGTRSLTAIPEVEEQDQPDRAGSHQNPADRVQIQPRQCPVHCERQDRAQREEENTYTNAHIGSTPASEAQHPNRVPIR